MNLKKLLTAGVASAVLVSGVVGANAMTDAGFYVGADANAGRFTYGDALKNAASATNNGLKRRSNSVDLIVGGKFHENFGAEVGYTFFQKTKAIQSPALNTTLKTRNVHVDAIGYAPVAQDVNLLGSVGVGRAKIKTEELGTHTHKTGYRAGVGAEYSVNEQFRVRLMARHQKLGKSSDSVKNLNTIGLGFNVCFM